MTTRGAMHRVLRRPGCVVSLALVTHLTAADGSSQQIRDAARAPAETGTALLAGTVSDGLGQPLSHAMVSAKADDAAAIEGMTDALGRFAIDRLPAARYTVTARKPAYLATAYGVTRVGRPGQVLSGSPIVLADGERRTDVTLTLKRGGVISGRILNPRGQPARAAGVTAYYKQSNGPAKPTFEPVPTDELGGSVLTDGRGDYRLFGLPPGEYVVAASVGSDESVSFRPTTDADVARALANARAGLATSDAAAAPDESTVGYSPTYYPGTAVAADATIVTVAAGQEVSGTDFQLQLVRISRIIGTILGVDGRLASGVRLEVDVPQRAGTTARVGTSDAQGHFVIQNVPPGAYRLATNPSPPWGQTDVTVNGEDVTTEIRLRPTVSISGHVTVSADSPADEKVRPEILVGLWIGPGNADDFYTRPAQVDSAGNFTLRDVVPDRYVVDAVVLNPSTLDRVDHSWAMESVSIGGRDVLDQSVEIGNENVSDVAVTLTRRTTRLSGRVTTAAGQPAPEYALIAFSRDSSRWSLGPRYVQAVQPKPDGSYSIVGLPPGSYHIAAVLDVTQDDREWLDADFLHQLVDQSITVTLAPREQRVLDIRAR